MHCSCGKHGCNACVTLISKITCAVEATPQEQMSVLNELYNVSSKYYLLSPPVMSVLSFFIDAPFGRFSLSAPSILLLDGVKSWIVGELVSPLGFIMAFATSPLTRPWLLVKRFPLSLPVIHEMKSCLGFQIPMLTPPGILVVLYLIHYANRAVISPLRTPVRSKSHAIVLSSIIIFNSVNGPLLGAFFSALAASSSGTRGLQSNTMFWLGVVMWFIGFTGNIWHDEVLLNIRRKPKSERRPSPGPDKKKDDATVGRDASKASSKPYYGIPYGGLYKFISYPNYITEWVEWTGYAIASTALANQLPAGHVIYPLLGDRVNLGALSKWPAIQWLTPPWLFLIAEVLTMTPRAWKGHRWYKKRFANYPQERKAVVPFLF